MIRAMFRMKSDETQLHQNLCKFLVHMSPPVTRYAAHAVSLGPFFFTNTPQRFPAFRFLLGVYAPSPAVHGQQDQIRSLKERSRATDEIKEREKQRRYMLRPKKITFSFPTNSFSFNLFFF